MERTELAEHERAVMARIPVTNARSLTTQIRNLAGHTTDVNRKGRLRDLAVRAETLAADLENALT